jgi:ribosomal protein S18 acetylase RimI-like enzyme
MITIEEARPEHVEAIVSLWKALMEIHKKLDAEFFDATDICIEEYASGIRGTISSSSDDRKVFVALANETVVGYVTIEIMHFSMLYYNFDSLCVIGDIMIDEKFHNQGIGERFIQEASKVSKKQNVNKIMLNVFSKNEKGYAYFKHLGFQDTFNKMTLKIE